MIYSLLFLVFLCLIAVIYLIVVLLHLKQLHQKHLRELDGVIDGLRLQQLLLQDKVDISSNFYTAYRNDMKTLGNEIVQLQKSFVEIISNKNIK